MIHKAIEKISIVELNRQAWIRKKFDRDRGTLEKKLKSLEMMSSDDPRSWYLGYYRKFGYGITWKYRNHDGVVYDEKILTIVKLKH